MRIIKVFIFIATAAATFMLFSAGDGILLRHVKERIVEVYESLTMPVHADSTSFAPSPPGLPDGVASAQDHKAELTDATPRPLPNPGDALLADLLHSIPRRDHRESMNSSESNNDTLGSSPITDRSNTSTPERPSMAEHRELTLAEISPAVAAKHRAITEREHANWARALKLLQEKP